MTFARVDAAAVVVSILGLVTLRILVVDSDWIAVVVAMLGVTAGVLASAAVVAPTRPVAAVVLVAIANWGIGIAVTVLVPFALTILPIALLLPVLLAVTWLDRVQMEAMLAATLAVAVVVALAGRLSSGVGLESKAPTWVLVALTVAFIPLCTGLACYVGWQNHRRLSSRARALQESRVRLVAATDRERRRIERDLHDGAQQRLVAVAVRLRVVARMLRPGQGSGPGSEPASAGSQERVMVALEELVEEVQNAARELRDLSHGVYPVSLGEQGLVAALRVAAARVPVPVRVVDEGVGRFAASVEAGVYFCCLEAIQNVVKHGGAGAVVAVRLWVGSGRDGSGGGVLHFEVSDTGVGCDPATMPVGHGMTNIADRVGALDGTLTVQARPGGGVTLHGTVAVDPEDASTPATSAGHAATAISLAAAAWRAWSRPFGRAHAEQSDEDIAAAGIRAQLVPTLGTVVAVLVLFGIFRVAALLVIAAATALAGAAFLLARRDLRRGRARRALLGAATTLWAYALLVTVMVPFTVAHTALLMVMPVFLAIPFLGAHFRLVITCTVAAAVLVAAAGALLPGTGIEDAMPPWLVDLLVANFVAVNTTIAGFLVLASQVSLSSRARALQESRVRLVAATDRERRRIERDLHDGAQQRLVAVAVRLRVVARMLRPGQGSAGSQERVRVALEELVEEVQDAARELRDLSHGVYPVSLGEQGLVAALRVAAARVPVPVRVVDEGVGRFAASVEAGVYFCCLEAIQNVVKHGGAGAVVSVRLWVGSGRDGSGGGVLHFEVSDTGVGCDPATLAVGHGMTNIADRVGALDGTFTVQARPGGGVTLHGTVLGVALPAGSAGPQPTGLRARRWAL